MRFLSYLLLGSLLYVLSARIALAWQAPHWPFMVLLCAIGAALQLTYTRCVNAFFDAIELPDSIRNRLRSDRDPVPLPPSWVFENRELWRDPDRLLDEIQAIKHGSRFTHVPLPIRFVGILARSCFVAGIFAPIVDWLPVGH
ncbi:MAG: hypothetical protein ACE141_15625 [Bryobacteraceae bacterium]